jgi:hypothetical protein
MHKRGPSNTHPTQQRRKYWQIDRKGAGSRVSSPERCRGAMFFSRAFDEHDFRSCL